MSVAAPMQTQIAKQQAVSNSKHGGLLLQRKCACGSPTSGAERAQPFRLKGPAIASIKLDAEIDATDSVKNPEQNANAEQFGIAPQLAVLEGLVNPIVAGSLALNALSQQFKDRPKDESNACHIASSGFDIEQKENKPCAL